MKRINMYSILINSNYKLPKNWKNIMEARKDIHNFISKNIVLTKELKEKLSLYDDKQWEKLIWRLHNNGHINNK